MWRIIRVGIPTHPNPFELRKKEINVMKQNKNRRKEKERESYYIYWMVMFELLYKVKKNHLNTPISFEIFLDPRQVLVS